MQRLLAFIEHNLYLILFVLLQAVSFILMMVLNPYQQASFTHAAAEVTGRTHTLSNNITDFIGLREQNRKLQDQVADRYGSSSEFTLTYMNDTFEVRDSLQRKLYSMIPAEVIYNTVYKANNVFVINVGSLHGVKKNMGVISSEGVAGLVLNTNTNFSTVMSLLNTDMKLVPSINGQEYFTELIWDNNSPYHLSIKGINKLEKIKVGDPITTGRSSLLFPADIPIGTVSELIEKENSQYFDTRLKTATTFRDLEYVYVIVNHHKKEVEALLNNE